MTDLKIAITEVQRAFPIPNYIGSETFYEMRAITNELRRFAPDFCGARLLDIGSGPMDKTGVLQKLGFECSAVDDLQDAWHQRDGNMQKIEAYARQVGIQFYRQQLGDYSIPFEENSFDVVSSFAVIEHLHESPRELLNVMGTFARDEGLLIITMPNSVNLRKRISVLMGRTNYPPVDMFYTAIGKWRGHVREYTLGETVHICQATGFEVISATTFEALAYQKLPALFAPVFMFLSRLVPTFRSGLLVVCRKPKGWQPKEADEDAFRRVIASAVPPGVA